MHAEKYNSICEKSWFFNTNHSVQLKQKERNGENDREKIIKGKRKREKIKRKRKRKGERERIGYTMICNLLPVVTARKSITKEPSQGLHEKQKH